MLNHLLKPISYFIHHYQLHKGYSNMHELFIDNRLIFAALCSIVAFVGGVKLMITSNRVYILLLNPSSLKPEESKLYFKKRFVVDSALLSLFSYLALSFVVKGFLSLICFIFPFVSFVSMNFLSLNRRYPEKKLNSV